MILFFKNRKLGERIYLGKNREVLVILNLGFVQLEIFNINQDWILGERWVGYLNLGFIKI